MARARSMTWQIFMAWACPSEPPRTVKSCAKTQTSRPLIVPKPVTTPSPGGFFSFRPKSAQRVLTSSPVSWKLPSSNR